MSSQLILRDPVSGRVSHKDYVWNEKKMLAGSHSNHWLPLVHAYGSFENEALENEDRSTKHPNLENEAPKTRKRSTLDRKRRPLNLENEAPKTRNHCRFNKCNFNFIISLTILDTSYLNMHFFGTHTCLCRLQNCPSADFGVFTYAWSWAVTQKVWNEAENGVWGSRVLLLRHTLPTALLISTKKTDCFAV